MAVIKQWTVGWLNAIANHCRAEDFSTTVSMCLLPSFQVPS